MASASVLEKLKSLAAELAGEVQSASLPLRGLAVGAVPHPEPGAEPNAEPDLAAPTPVLADLDAKLARLQARHQQALQAGAHSTTLSSNTGAASAAGPDTEDATSAGSKEPRTEPSRTIAQPKAPPTTTQSQPEGILASSASTQPALQGSASVKASAEPLPPLPLDPPTSKPRTLQGSSAHVSRTAPSVAPSQTQPHQTHQCRHPGVLNTRPLGLSLGPGFTLSQQGADTLQRLLSVSALLDRKDPISSQGAASTGVHKSSRAQMTSTAPATNDAVRISVGGPGRGASQSVREGSAGRTEGLYEPSRAHARQQQQGSNAPAVTPLVTSALHGAYKAGSLRSPSAHKAGCGRSLTGHREGYGVGLGGVCGDTCVWSEGSSPTHGEDDSPVDLTDMRRELPELMSQIQGLQSTADELSADRDCLIAERTAVIMHTQALAVTLSHGDGCLGAVDSVACDAAETRVRGLVERLPLTGAIKDTLGTSELLPQLRRLREEAAAVHHAWSGERSHLHQRVQELETQLNTATQEASAAVSAQRVLEDQVRRLQDQRALQQTETAQQLQRLRQQCDTETQQARQAVQEASHLNERVSELQTRCGLLEAAVRERDTEHTRELEQCRLQERSAAQAQAERQVAEVLAAESRVREGLQSELLAARHMAETALGRAQSSEEDQRLHTLHAMKAGRLQDQLSDELQRVKEENLNLKIIVREAEKQLVSLRSDIDTLRVQRGGTHATGMPPTNHYLQGPVLWNDGTLLGRPHSPLQRPGQLKSPRAALFKHPLSKGPWHTESLPRSQAGQLRASTSPERRGKNAKPFYVL